MVTVDLEEIRDFYSKLRVQVRSRIQGPDVDPEIRVQVWIQNPGTGVGPGVNPESRVQIGSRVQVWIQNLGTGVGPGVNPDSMV